MIESQINMRIPKEVWDKVGLLAAKRTLEGRNDDTKKAVVADAIEAYYKLEVMDND